VFNVPPPNFSVPPPPINLREKFTRPPPTTTPPPIPCHADLEEVPRNSPSPKLDEPHDFEIGYWFGVPMTPKSILKNPERFPDFSKKEKKVRFCDAVTVVKARKAKSVDSDEDDLYCRYNNRPKSCKIPERFPYSNSPSRAVIRVLNQGRCGVNANKRMKQNENKYQKRSRVNPANLIVVV
jgi:hypothetical protein